MTIRDEDIAAAAAETLADVKELNRRKGRATFEALAHIAGTPVKEAFENPALCKVLLASVVGTASNLLAFIRDEVDVDEYCDIEQQFAQSTLLAGSKVWADTHKKHSGRWSQGVSNDDAATQQAA